MDKENKWVKLKALATNREMEEIMNNVDMEDIYECYILNEGNIRFFIIVADNGRFFAIDKLMGVHLFVEGVPMPEDHSHKHNKEEFCVGSTYLSNVFCVNISKDIKERVKYLKKNYWELSGLLLKEGMPTKNWAIENKQL